MYTSLLESGRENGYPSATNVVLVRVVVVI